MKVALVVDNANTDLLAITQLWGSMLQRQGLRVHVVALDLAGTKRRILPAIFEWRPRIGSRTHSHTKTTASPPQLQVAFDALGGHVDVLHCVGESAAQLALNDSVRASADMCALSMSPSCIDAVQTSWSDTRKALLIDACPYLSGIGAYSVTGLARLFGPQFASTNDCIEELGISIDTSFWIPNPSVCAPVDQLRVLYFDRSSLSSTHSNDHETALEGWAATLNARIVQMCLDDAVTAIRSNPESSSLRSTLWETDLVMISDSALRSDRLGLCDSAVLLRTLACSVPVIWATERAATGESSLGALRSSVQQTIARTNATELPATLDRLSVFNVRSDLGHKCRAAVVESASLRSIQHQLMHWYRNAAPLQGSIS